MNLAARTTGFGVPPDTFDGTVHSTFHSACIIDIGGAILSFVPGRGGGLPFGITLDGVVDLDFMTLCRAGDRVALRAGIVRFAGEGLSVDLRPAAPFRSRLDGLAIDLHDLEAGRAWSAVFDLLNSDGRIAGLAAVGHAPIATLIAAARSGDSEEARAAAERLVGLGQGGTPAGDDFLVGFVAALHALRRTPRIAGILASLRDVLQRSADRTNAISRSYLEAACAGEVSEKLTRLARALSENRDVREAATAAIAVGHTSGADGALGLLAGLVTGGPSELTARIERRLATATAPAPVKPPSSTPSPSSARRPSPAPG